MIVTHYRKVTWNKEIQSNLNVLTAIGGLSIDISPLTRSNLKQRNSIQFKCIGYDWRTFPEIKYVILWSEALTMGKVNRQMHT